jgi:aspartyl aminopeptidase
MEEAVKRISAALDTSADAGTPDRYASTIAHSFCLSIDQAHAIHPNYSSKHESQHAPLINNGIVLKANANQRYATTSTTGFLLREIARRGNVPIQDFVGTSRRALFRSPDCCIASLRLHLSSFLLSFGLLKHIRSVVRNDCPCGSTIGPIISTRTGIRTVDAGMPQLSMHSCREVMGVADIHHGVSLMTSFFQHFRSIDDSLAAGE